MQGNEAKHHQTYEATTVPRCGHVPILLRLMNQDGWLAPSLVQEIAYSTRFLIRLGSFRYRYQPASQYLYFTLTTFIYPRQGFVYREVPYVGARFGRFLIFEHLSKLLSILALARSQTYQQTAQIIIHA